MRNAGFAAVALLSAVFGCAVSTAAGAEETNANAADSNRVVVELQDDGRALINPGPMSHIPICISFSRSNAPKAPEMI